MLSITELSCRVCLQEQSVLINIYDELEDLHTNLRNLLETCVGLQIDDKDIFPKYLCEECTTELLITSKFRKKCDSSTEIFGEILRNNQLDASNDLKPVSDADAIIEYAVEELDCNEDLDLLIEKDTGIVSLNENEFNEVVDKKPAVIKEAPLSLLKKNGLEGLQEDLITTSEEPPEYIDFEKDIIVEDHDSIQSESLAECSETGTTELFEKIETEVPASSAKANSPSKVVVEKLKKPSLVFKCDICGALFKQAFNLQKHLQKSHDPLQCFSCAKCDHWFSQEAEFSKHIQNCNYSPNVKDSNDEIKKTKVDKIFRYNLEQEPHRKCIYCEKEFPTPFALRMHIRTHTGERPFQCKFCTKSFKTQSQLNVHHKRHTGQADFTCSICNKVFYEQSNLTVHMRSHTGERPHICTICNKTFARVFLLQFHMRTHTGEKPFSGTYCYKNFRQPTDLRSHLAIHTGQKQHVCFVCGKSYIRRSHLVQHMLKHNINSNDIESGEKVQEDVSDTIAGNIQSFLKNSEQLGSCVIEKDNDDDR